MRPEAVRSFAWWPSARSDPVPVPPARDWRGELRALFGLAADPEPAAGRAAQRLTTFVVLTVTLWLMPGVASADIVDTLGLVVLVAGVGAVLRPLLLAGVTALGGWGAMLLGVMVQVIVIMVALELDPADRISGLPTLVVAAILAVIFAAILDWMADSGTDDTFVKEAKRLMRAVRRRQARQAGGPFFTLRRPPPGTEPGHADRAARRGGRAGAALGGPGRATCRPSATGCGPAATACAAGTPACRRRRPPRRPASCTARPGRSPAFRWFEKDTGKLMVVQPARATRR